MNKISYSSFKLTNTNTGVLWDRVWMEEWLIHLLKIQ